MLETTIGGVKFNGLIFNASGPKCTDLDELELIGDSESSAIMMKSCTLENREGNPSPRYCELPMGSINSMGLPNLGYKKYIEFAGSLKSFNKPIFASIAGLTPNDFPLMVKEFQDKSVVDLIEVNFSCPNVPGKPQIGYDFQATDTILSKIDNIGKKPLGIKLPPYFDFAHYEIMAEIISKHNVSFVTCINSVGNTLVIDPETETPLIKPKGGFGGLGGEYVKPIALANVRKFYELIGDKVSIIGCGGIINGVDAFEFILAGASALQVATQFEIEGESCFHRIQVELEDYMDMKGYKSIDDFRGKIKSL